MAAWLGELVGVSTSGCRGCWEVGGLDGWVDGRGGHSLGEHFASECAETKWHQGATIAADTSGRLVNPPTKPSPQKTYSIIDFKNSSHFARRPKHIELPLCTPTCNYSPNRNVGPNLFSYYLCSCHLVLRNQSNTIKTHSVPSTLTSASF